MKQALKDVITQTISVTNNYKILLFDEFTRDMITTSYMLTELVLNNVIYSNILENDIMDKNIGNFKWMDCIIYVRRSSINNIIKELKNPRYNKYYINFSNRISDEDLDLLAEEDIHNVIYDIKEIYADFSIIQDNVLIINCEYDDVNIISDSIISYISNLKQNPLIRYVNKSKIAYSIAEMINKSNEFLTTNKNNNITPLLNGWTYQTMIHEIINIYNNRIKIIDDSQDQIDENNISKNNIKEFVLSSDTDEFYKENMFKIYAELSDSFKILIEKYRVIKLKYKDIQKDDINKIKDFLMIIQSI